MQIKSSVMSWRATTALFDPHCVYTGEHLTGQLFSREHIVPVCRLALKPEAMKDFHNLWPALKSVNTARANYKFGVLDSFDTWQVDRVRGIFSPPRRAQGIIARTIIRMSELYPLVDMSKVIDFKALEIWQGYEITDYERQHDELASAAMRIAACSREYEQRLAVREQLQLY